MLLLGTRVSGLVKSVQDYNKIEALKMIHISWDTYSGLKSMCKNTLETPILENAERKEAVISNGLCNSRVDILSDFRIPSAEHSA